MDSFGLKLVVVLSVAWTVAVAQTTKETNSPAAVALEPGPVIGGGEKPPDLHVSCEPDDVKNCFGRLHTFLKLNRLPFPTKEELNHLCEISDSGRNCSSQLHLCFRNRADEVVPLLSEMSLTVSRSLCREDDMLRSSMRKSLLLNSQCISSQADRLECCSKESDLPELPILRIIETTNAQPLEEKRKHACCPVSRFLGCVKSVLLSTCGQQAFELFTSYAQLSAGQELGYVCRQRSSSFPERDPGFCPDETPECSGSEPAVTGTRWIIVILLMLLSRWIIVV